MPRNHCYSSRTEELTMKQCQCHNTPCLCDAKPEERGCGEEMSVSEKAALWDALMKCDRIRVLGYARRDNEGKEGQINHIGFELWREFKPKKAVIFGTALGRDLLTEFAQKA
jgi:hypothetical protein